MRRAGAEKSVDNEVELDGSEELLVSTPASTEAPSACAAGRASLSQLAKAISEIQATLEASKFAVRGLEDEVRRLKERRSSRDSRRRLIREVTDYDTEAAKGEGAGGFYSADAELSYELRQSIWDSTFILGLHDHRGSGVDTLVGLALIILNMLIQVGFLLILAFETELKSQEITGEEDRFLDWRLGVGHHVKHFDPATSTSLTARVCSGYDAAILSYEQKQVSTEIGLYTMGFGSWGYGRPLCALAVGIWTLWVFRELATVWEFTMALWSLPHGETTDVARFEREDGPRREFRRLSRFRFWSVLLGSSIPRALIAVGLWLTGSFWLTYTRGMNDLILNCVALGFVMQVAEILYGFLPLRLRHVMDFVEPLQRRRALASQCLSADSKSLALLAVFALFMSIWFATTFQTFHQNLEKTREILCGGEQDFVYTTHPVTGVVKKAATVPLAGGSEVALFNGEPHVYDVVLQATGLVGRGLVGRYKDPAVAFKSESISEIAAVGDVAELFIATVEEAAALVPCVNLDQRASDRVAMKTRVNSDALCEDLEAQCHEFEVRLFCSVTCRCHDALSGIYNRTGCAPSCTKNLTEQHNALETARRERSEPCQDTGLRGRNVSFFRELQGALQQSGVLTWGGSGLFISRAFKEEFENRTGANWTLDQDVEVDLPTWFAAALAKEESCWLVPHIIYVFQVDLCSMDSLGNDVGHLATLCPATCQVCTGDRLETVAQEWSTTQGAFGRIGVFLLHPRASVIFALGNQVSFCERPGTSPSEVTLNGDTRDGERNEALPGVTRPSPSLTYAFKSHHAGNYTFQVLATFKPVMNLWSASTFQKEHDGNSTRKESCLKVHLPAGGDFALVIGGVKAEDRGSFRLQIHCPWNQLDDLPEYCPVDPGVQEEELDDEPAGDSFGLQASPCRGQVQFPVYGSRCEEAARALDLVVTKVELNAAWAPLGCSYLEDTKTLLVDGTGTAGTECGRHPSSELTLGFQCICSAEDRPLKWSSDVSACDQGDSGACRACVELLDDWCSVSLWDVMCYQLCSTACREVCQSDTGQTAFDVELGPCMVRGTQSGGHCVESPMHPGSYGSGEYCSISVRQPAQWQVSIRQFKTEEEFDILYIDGVPFSGEVDGTQMTLPQVQSIIWTSDALNSQSGWQLCAEPAGPPEECRDADDGATNLLGQDCAYLAERSPYCATEYDTANFSVRTMCCHCHGGSTRSGAWSCPRKYVGERWKLVRRTSSDVFPESDKLRGSAAWGSPHSDPLGADMSVRFDDVAFDEFLFTTGDCWEWILMQRTEVQAWYSSSRQLRSHLHPEQLGSALMDRRPDTSPIITLDFYNHPCGSLYAEGTPLSSEDCPSLHVRTGFNVFVRQRCSRPESWCGGPSTDEYELADCNGDGWLDHRCTLESPTASGSTVVLSEEACPEPSAFPQPSAGVHGACDECRDAPGFVDERGWICSDWQLYECEHANEDFGYSQEGEDALLRRCHASCSCTSSVLFDYTPYQTLGSGECNGTVLMEQPAGPSGCENLCTAYTTCAGYSIGGPAERQCILFTEVASAVDGPRSGNLTTSCWVKSAIRTSEGVKDDLSRLETAAPTPAPFAPPLDLPCIPSDGYRFLRLSNGGPIRKATCDATWSLHEVVVETPWGMPLAMGIDSVSSAYEASYYAPSANVLDGDPETFWAGDPWANSTLTGLGTDCFEPSKVGSQWIALSPQDSSILTGRIAVSQHPTLDLFAVSLLRAECSADNVSWTLPMILPIATTGWSTIFATCPETIYVSGAAEVQPLAMGAFTVAAAAASGVSRVEENGWWPIYMNSEQKYLFFSTRTTSWWIGEDYRSPAGVVQGLVSREFCPQDAQEWLIATTGNWTASVSLWLMVDLRVSDTELGSSSTR